MSLTLAKIINIGDPARKGVLTSFGSSGKGSMNLLIRGDGVVLDLRLVQPSASPAVRPFDDYDPADAIGADGLIVAVGKPDEDPWFWCESWNAVAITPVAVSTAIVGTGTQNEVQLITLGEGVYGGTYSLALELKDFGTGTGIGSNVTRTYTLSATMTADQIATELLKHPEAVKSGKNGIKVTGSVGGPFTVEFCEHQGLHNAPVMVVTDINLLVPKRVTGVLSQQPALATAFAATTSNTLSGTFEISIEEPGDEPSTVLQVPVTIARDVITNSAASNADAGAFKFLSGVTGYTGGGATKLDGVVTAGKTYNVVAFPVTGDGLRFYQLVAGTDAEASPGIIRPDDYNGATNAKVWKSLL